MPFLGDVFLNTVYSEKPEGEVEITEHPIEGGGVISDHVERKPTVLSISGVVTGPDASLRLSKLEQYRRTGTPLIFRYRSVYSNMLIASFSRDHGIEVKGGFKYTMVLQEVRFSKPSIIKDLKLPQKVQVKSVTNKGRQQTKPTTKTLTESEKKILREMGHNV